jgi:asparagine synthetase B (glutamine-hydrolysing)
MCGIFGVIANEDKYNRKVLIKILEVAAKLSQVRGKDSSGLAFRFESSSQIDVLRGPVSIDELLKTKEYKEFKTSILNELKVQNNNKIFAALGHARLVTNGSQLEDVNNQPVVKDGIVGIHNGIIVNETELWAKHPNLKREYEIDTEVIFSIFRHYLNKLGNSVAAVKRTNKELFGTVSTGFFINDREEFVVYTNNGSLYILTNNKDLFIFGSEKDILHRLMKKNSDLFNQSFDIKQVSANSGYLLQYKDFKLTGFDLIKEEELNSSVESANIFQIRITNYHPKEKQLHAVIDPSKFINGIKTDNERKLLEYNIERISALKRCTKCLLPETFPFIVFDEKGVCNICNNYKKKNHPKSINELQELVEPYRKKNGQTDCLVPFSGGRDSTYVLHIVKNILNLNPIAFTYDWGMVTDLGRRNIARVTGKLGVENIIVSANIRWKRENIRKNINAWLKNPELGMVPLFMAGDKYFFYYTDKVKKQNDIKLNIWGINPLENTDFKVGFCGLPLRFNKKRIYSISVLDQLKLFGYVGKNILKSPSYINQSIIDTLGSFASRYIVPKRDYYHMFDYYSWDEKEIEDLIINEYKWETAIDTKTTWRIGDGTAGFYNYLYYTVAGFSEYDTFRSNQIREGMLTREKALLLVNEENIPRYESIKWYFEIIGLDFETVIKRINSIPKLY